MARFNYKSLDKITRLESYIDVAEIYPKLIEKGAEYFLENIYKSQPVLDSEPYNDYEEQVV